MTASFAERLRDFLDSAAPGHNGAKLKLSLPGGIVETIRVPACPPRVASATLDALDETDRDIVQAAEEAGRRMSADDLAAAAGYENNSRFRERLGRLVRGGHLAKRHPGYAHPDAND